MGSDYPKREKFFFCKFARAIYLLGVANEVGPDGIALLLAIASTEDSLKYIKPPNFWNTQLMNMCGFHTEGTLIRARKKLVDSGLVHYEKGSKSKAGIYWVVASPETAEASGNLHHENDPLLTIEFESQSVGNIEVNPKLIRNQSVTQALPSYPVPVPDSEPNTEEPKFDLSNSTSKKEYKRRSKKEPQRPTIEEVKAHCEADGAGIDHEEFFHYYEGRDWHYKDGSPVLSWKSAYVTWKKMQMKFSSHSNGNGHSVSAKPLKLPDEPVPSSSDRVIRPSPMLLQFEAEQRAKQQEASAGKAIDR